MDLQCHIITILLVKAIATVSKELSISSYKPKNIGSWQVGSLNMNLHWTEHGKVDANCSDDVHGYPNKWEKKLYRNTCITLDRNTIFGYRPQNLPSVLAERGPVRNTAHASYFWYFSVSVGYVYFRSGVPCDVMLKERPLDAESLKKLGHCI